MWRIDARKATALTRGSLVFRDQKSAEVIVSSLKEVRRAKYYLVIYTLVGQGQKAANPKSILGLIRRG